MSSHTALMYLAGHTQPATTARYMRPQKSAAEEVLRAASGAGEAEFWLHSGCKKPDANRRHGELSRKEKPRTTCNDSGFSVVRRGGLEPPWLLTASTSIHNNPNDSNDFEELERQETSESVPERPILATCSQNSEAADPVAEWLCDACRIWAEHHEPRELRKVLLAIMGLLDA
jgi:hypothetical protein